MLLQTYRVNFSAVIYSQGVSKNVDEISVDELFSPPADSANRTKLTATE